MERKLCFATNNLHKLAEAKHLLDRWFEVVSLKDIGCVEELPETTGTITGNSLQKAKFVFQKFGVNCFADDSGLEVIELDGAPGVDSAMYAGPQRSHDDNINLLLKNLQHTSHRRARFITIITLLNSGRAFQFEGVLSGMIALEKRGTEGFGYDPVFVPDGHARTLAEMSMIEKNAISHRAQALGKLLRFLESGNVAVADTAFDI